MTFYHTEPLNELPKIVYLHGLTATGPRSLPIFSKIAAKFQIFLPSARGHGKSSQFPEGTFTMDTVVEDTAAFIRHISPSEKIFLIGFSFGGATAARTTKKYPHLIQALVLEDPPWKRKFNEPFIISKDDPGPWLFFNVSKKLKQMTDSEFDKVKNDSPFSIISTGRGPRGPPPVFSPAEGPFGQTMLQGLREMAVENIEKTFIDGAERYITEAVEGIEVPTILMTGEPGKGHCKPEVAKHTISTWNNGREKNFPGAGHGFHNPPYQEEFLKTIVEFFEQF